MSRNRYTKLVHEIDRARGVRREKALAAFIRELRCKAADRTAPPDADDGKQHRRARLEQRRQHKPERFRSAETQPVLTDPAQARS